MAFITEDFADISVEELEDWGDLVLNPDEEELGVSSVRSVTDREHDIGGTGNGSSKDKVKGKAKSSEGQAVKSKKKTSSSSKKNNKTRRTVQSEAKGSSHAVDQEVQGNVSTDSQSRKADEKTQSKTFFVLKPESRSKMESEAVSIVSTILDSVSSAERFSGKHGYGGQVKSLAQKIVTFENSDLELMSKHLLNAILDLVASVEKTPVGAALQEETFKKFHILRLAEEHREMWKVFLRKLQVDSGERIVGNLLYQFLLERLLGHVILLVGSKQSDQEADNPRADFSDRELQVLRYISGFIPYALLKRYRRAKSPLAKEYVKILQSWRASQDKETMAPSFLAYTIAWMEMQNRGGLFCVTDEVFRFFWACERVAKPFLDKKKIGELRKTNIKTTLFKLCSENDKVLQLWNSLICPYSINTELKPLFYSIMNYFTKIRINAFVKAFNLVEKQAKRASSKGQKSLRKELAK